MTGLLIGIFLLTVLAILLVSIPLIKHKATGVVFIIFVFLPIISGVLYLYWGDPWGLSDYRVIQQLQTYLNQHPVDQDSAQGWYLLGKIYLKQGDYHRALQSFAIAHAQNRHALKLASPR